MNNLARWGESLARRFVGWNRSGRSASGRETLSRENRQRRDVIGVWVRVMRRGEQGALCRRLASALRRRTRRRGRFVERPSRRTSGRIDRDGGCMAFRLLARLGIGSGFSWNLTSGGAVDDGAQSSVG